MKNVNEPGVGPIARLKREQHDLKSAAVQLLDASEDYNRRARLAVSSRRTFEQLLKELFESEERLARARMAVKDCLLKD